MALGAFASNASVVSLTTTFTSVLSSPLSITIAQTSQQVFIFGASNLHDNAPGSGTDSTLALFLDGGQVSSAVFGTNDGTGEVAPTPIYATTGLSVGAHTVDLRASLASGNGSAQGSRVSVFIIG